MIPNVSVKRKIKSPSQNVQNCMGLRLSFQIVFHFLGGLRNS